MNEESLRKKMQTLLLTSRHIGFMESEGSHDEYKILSLEDELAEMVEELFNQLGGE